MEQCSTDIYLLDKLPNSLSKDGTAGPKKTLTKKLENIN